MKRIISMLLAAMLLLGMMPTFAFAATSGTTGDCTWTLNGTELTISGNGAMGNYFYNSHPWGENITSVVIENGVTTIGEDAFYNCESLTFVTIADSVITIGSSAFFSCDSLTSVTIPDSVTTIGDDVFKFCGSLTSVTIGNSVTSIGNYAFQDCSSLTSVTIPDSVTTIGSSAFYFCDSLISATIGNSVTAIGFDAFSHCDSLTSVTIGNSVTTIGYDAFSYCDSLTSITIPDSVTTIGARAFLSCGSLSSVTIGNGVTSIGASAFSSWISSGSVYITDIAKWCAINFADSHSNPLCDAENLYLNGALINDLVIPDGVTTIGDYVFYGCGSLTSITIPNSVTTIGSSAFSSCDSLTSITIPDSVTTIGEYAFYNCGSLKKLALPASITKVESSAFKYSGVKVVYIPKEITLIKNGAFDETEINYVYYGGSEADKENLTILPNNDSLNSATWVYNATGLPQCQYGKYVYNNDATTTKDGTKTRTCSVCGDKQTVTAEGTKIQINPFGDVKKSDFYYTPVLWAVENGITSGTSKTTFGPNEACTRGQIATFLWRAAGCPAPKTSKNPFTDVKKKDYYYKAVLWAVGEGITSGTSKTTFGPNEACTRGQIATFLWRANGGKKVNASNPFKDVKKSDYYYNAVLWAVKNGITAGATKTTFAPNDACTRGQIATFLYRAYN